MLDDARRFGFDAASMAELEQALGATPGDQDEDRRLWPQHVAIVNAFLAAETQWRVVSVGMGLAPGSLLVNGLDYAGARAGIEAAGIEITPSLWTGLRVMEAEALRVMNGSRR